MPKRVFFSFYFERDIWRANQVRNCWVTRDDEAVPFHDASLWEEAKKKGDAAIKAMIDRALDGTSTTIVLIGAETYARQYCQYEIVRSWNRGNKLLGIRIHNLENRFGLTDTQGPNPFDYVTLKSSGARLSAYVPVYDWVAHGGYRNCRSWIDALHRE